jgi:hypothetical protein
MNLSNLKPAWQQFRLRNSLQPLSHQEILFILESAEGMAVNKTHRLMVNTLVFVVYTFCCQGG